MCECAGRCIRVVHDEGTRLRAGWCTLPRERWRYILAVARISHGNAPVRLERARLQRERANICRIDRLCVGHESLNRLGNCYAGLRSAKTVRSERWNRDDASLIIG